jgi:SAM-dependent methyltransferase
MRPTDPAARFAPATARNREPILEVLRDRLPPSGLVVEVAAGTGEHAVWFAGGLPGLTWLPTDRAPDGLASIAAWREAAGLPNLLPPATLDAADPSSWPVEQADAVVCINMLHISPWAAAEGLFTGAARVTTAGGVLFLYGPFIEPDVATAPSNLAFDRDLKSRDPAWGLRNLDVVTALAKRHSFVREARIAMPANNLSVVFRRL